jgi:hypothetical protein
MKSTDFITEAEARRMSRAAKGNEKYGKDGMKALAKARREGASEKTLDAIRDKHNKYDESVDEAAKGLYYNVNKRKAAGTSRDKDDPRAPTAQAWKDAAKTAKKESVEEEWSKKYKDSINCSNPKGFSQKAHCAGKNEDVDAVGETAAWRRKEGKSKTGGLNKKGVASYRRENPGSKLQTAVTTKPSKLKPGSKAAKRRKSFCARMGGVKGPMKKPNGKPTRKALALRKWNCESVEQLENMLVLAEAWAKQKGIV